MNERSRAEAERDSPESAASAAKRTHAPGSAKKNADSLKPLRFVQKTAEHNVQKYFVAGVHANKESRQKLGQPTFVCPNFCDPPPSPCSPPCKCHCHATPHPNNCVLGRSCIVNLRAGTVSPLGRTWAARPAICLGVLPAGGRMLRMGYSRILQLILC